MRRERIGKTFAHKCGYIWQTRAKKVYKCPGCFGELKKGEFKVIAKDDVKEWFEW